MTHSPRCISLRSFSSETVREASLAPLPSPEASADGQLASGLLLLQVTAELVPASLAFVPVIHLS